MIYYTITNFVSFLERNFFGIKSKERENGSKCGTKQVQIEYKNN